MKTKIRELEENTWKNFVIAHPCHKLAKTCLDVVSLEMFWSVFNQYPDLVRLLSLYGPWPYSPMALALWPWPYDLMAPDSCFKNFVK